jgi:hypothetical protein
VASTELPRESSPRLEGCEWRSSTGAAPPRDWRFFSADDPRSAETALRLVRGGQSLLCVERYAAARSLLTSMQRLLDGERRPRMERADLAALFRTERRRRSVAHALLARVLVVLDGPDFRPRLDGAPALGPFGRQVWGAIAETPMLVPFREWIGALGASEWYRRGVDVPGLGARIHPHYGVFPPTRRDYLQLIAMQAARTNFSGKTAFDIGTGTGVLALLIGQAWGNTGDRDRYRQPSGRLRPRKRLKAKADGIGPDREGRTGCPLSDRHRQPDRLQSPVAARRRFDLSRPGRL